MEFFQEEALEKQVCSCVPLCGLQSAAQLVK